MENKNGKFEDLIQLHKDQVLTTFETLLIHELRVLNYSIDGIYHTLNESEDDTMLNRIASIPLTIEESTEKICDYLEGIGKTIDRK